MMNDWSEFKGVTQRASLRHPRVTLGKNRDMYFSARTLELLGDPAAIRYFYDVARNIIGIRKESPDIEHAYPVYRGKGVRNTTGKVYAGTFCRAYNIRLDHSIAFHDIHLDADGIMILDLNTATRVRRITSKLLIREEQIAKNVRS